MLPWKLQKRQILPVNQNFSSVYFSLAKFPLVTWNLPLAMIWQMTHTHKLPKLCSDTLTHCLRTGLTMNDACWFTSYNNYHKKIIDRLSQWPATILKSWLIKSTLQRKTVRNHSHLSISGALNAMPNRDILQR